MKEQVDSSEEERHAAEEDNEVSSERRTHQIDIIFEKATIRHLL